MKSIYCNNKHFLKIKLAKKQTLKEICEFRICTFLNGKIFITTINIKTWWIRTYSISKKHIMQFLKLMK